MEKREIYRQIQATHIHASPDGPWFFIIARSHPDLRRLQLLGITDTAMLRPQVFALQEGRQVSIGLICSEKQAIDATLATGNPVVIGLNAYGGTHFVVFVSGSKGNYLMRDPYIANGKDISFSTHYAIKDIFSIAKVVISS